MKNMVIITLFIFSISSSFSNTKEKISVGTSKIDNYFMSFNKAKLNYTNVYRLETSKLTGMWKLIGFALETENEQANAVGKLDRNPYAIIVLNSLKDKGAGFQHNSNKVTIIDRNNKVTSFELKSKQEVAIDILDAIENN